jgi:hypothetical protein
MTAALTFMLVWIEQKNISPDDARGVITTFFPLKKAAEQPNFDVPLGVMMTSWYVLVPSLLTGLTTGVARSFIRKIPAIPEPERSKPEEITNCLSGAFYIV